MFPVRSATEEFKNETNTIHFGFVFEENSGRKSRDYPDAIVAEKLRFENVFYPHDNDKPQRFL